MIPKIAVKVKEKVNVKEKEKEKEKEKVKEKVNVKVTYIENKFYIGEMIKMKEWADKNFEESQSENINNIYRAMFPNIKQIKRSKRGANKEQLYFDKSLGIDTFITFDNGSQITIQEKIRREKSLEEYNPCLCIEYMNDICKVGEWFYAIPQYYFVGYVNTYTDNIIEWYLIDTARLKTLFMNWNQKELEEKYLKKNVPPKRANFLAIPINDISKAVIVCNNYNSITK